MHQNRSPLTSLVLVTAVSQTYWRLVSVLVCRMNLFEKLLNTVWSTRCRVVTLRFEHIRIVSDLSAPTLIPPSFTHRSIEVTLGQLYAEKYTPVLTYLGIPISHYLLYVDDHYTYLVYPFLSVLLINYHEPLESPRLRNNCGHEPVHSQGCIEL